MGVEHNNQEQQQQQTGFEPKLINEASEKEMALDSGQCGACGRRGFPLFLVRKSIVPKTFQSATAWEQGMVSLGDREPQPASWQDYHYAYRTLREGYVYILCNRIGNTDDNKLEIMVYEVTHGGAFRLREFRDVKGSRPKDIPQSCVSANHHVKAQFITIDNRVYDKAWIAYTPVRWTIATLKHYRNTASEREQRFSKVDLTQQKATNVSAQGRSFVFRDFLNKARFLLELECDNRSVCDYFEDESLQGAQQSATALGDNPLLNSMRKGLLGKQGKLLSDLLSSTASALTRLFNQTFYTASHFNSLNNPDARAALDLTVSKYELDKEYGTAELTALVVEDSFGVAEELAIQRRQRLGPVAEGLSEQSETSKQALSPFTHLVRNSSHDIIYEQQRKAAQSKLASAMQESGGRDTFAQYYQEKAASINSYPLAYFTPEVAYARNHYRHIEQYKASVRASITENGDKDAYLFLFYKASESYQSADENNTRLSDAIAANNHRFIDTFKMARTPFKTFAELKDIDKINVRDVVGEEALAEKLGVDYVDTWKNRHYASDETPFLNPGYLYCARLSASGLSSLTFAGLGPYKDVPLSDVQQKALLAQYANEPRDGTYDHDVDSVMVVHFYDLTSTQETLANKKLAREWKDRKKRLNQSSVSNYEQLEKDGYASLLKYVDDSSKDYYHYLIWLFGEDASYYQADKAKTKASLPNALNTLPFWRNEIIPNSSDMHVSFLITFLVILDSDNIGTMTLPLHAALWGLLFNNAQSIYFYLLGDIKPKDSPNNADDETYWNSLVARQTDNTSSTKQVASKSPAVQQSPNTDSQSGEGIKEIDGKDLYDIGKVIFTAGNENNQSIVKLLIEKMLSTSLEGVNKAVSQQVQINDLMARSHFLKAMNLFKGSNVERLRQYQVTMTVKGLQRYLKKMDELTPFFFSEQMKTDKGNIINVIKNQQERWHIPQSGNKAIASQKVTVNMLMAFENAEGQQKFEAALKRSPNGSFSNATLNEIQPNIIEVGGTVFNDTDIDTLSAAVTRNKRYVEVFDTSVTFVLGLVSLYFQMNALQDLQKQLDTNPDPLVKLKVMMSYGAVMSASTELTMQFFIAASSSSDLFLGRGANLYSFLSQHLTKIQNIGKSIGIIDSILSVALSLKSVEEGNTGSAVYLVTSLLSLCVSGAALFAIPIWGQIALVFVGIGLAIISALNYSDGSEWDEIDKWLNRSMLGNFDFHASKYPPYYLPTPVCMQLSQQDYYLAVNGGICKLEPESSLMSNQYDLYLTLNLPDFNEKISKFEGTVTIKPIIGESVTLNISRGNGQLNIQRTTPALVAKRLVSLTNAFSVATGSLDNKKERYSMDEKIAKKLGKDEALWNALMAVTTGQSLTATTPATAGANNSDATKIGLFLIKQRLGQINGVHNASISVNYWPNGKVDKEGQEITPYLFSHHYTKIKEVSLDEQNIID
ncbi:hypothetical protein RHO13_00165 [Orbus wheelerorum]|uniref:toxin VasX n=1 Tax=Orbus wheelerorum TaxID=3074111 RepID=UPI00370D2B87